MSNIAEQEIVKVILGQGYKKQIDTHSAWDADRKLFTCPISGMFEIQVSFKTQKVDELLLFYIIKNKTQKLLEIMIPRRYGDSMAYSSTLRLPRIFAGDTLELPEYVEDIYFLKIDRCGYSGFMSDWTEYDHDYYRRIGNEIELKIAPPFSYAKLPLGIKIKYKTLISYKDQDGNERFRAEVEGWSSKAVESYVPADSPQYKISGEITVSTPGTYKIGEQTIKLNSGSMSIQLSNLNVQTDGTIKVPFIKES